MSALDPRLDRRRPALVYGPQEAFRAMSAASITDYGDKALKRRNHPLETRTGTGRAVDRRAAAARPAEWRRGKRPGGRAPPS